jgi:hypothetical protein
MGWGAQVVEMRRTFRQRRRRRSPYFRSGEEKSNGKFSACRGGEEGGNGD